METVAPKYRDYLAKHKMSVIDTGVLAHQIPGGMISNLVSQLKEAKALDRLPEVHREVALTRKELGTPPLVTPTSQIVGVQAVLNVLFGKYKMVTNEVKDLVFGLYGKTPTPVYPEVQEIVLKGYKRGQTPVTGRAADYLEPELDKVRERAGDLAKDDFDLLITALYPATGEKFLKWKYGLEERPPEVLPKTLEDIRKEDEAMAAALEQVCKTL
jgi:pyruvate carboxylase subunit B